MVELSANPRYLIMIRLLEWAREAGLIRAQEAIKMHLKGSESHAHYHNLAGALFINQLHQPNEGKSSPFHEFQQHVDVHPPVQPIRQPLPAPTEQEMDFLMRQSYIPAPVSITWPTTLRVLRSSPPRLPSPFSLQILANYFPHPTCSPTMAESTPAFHNRLFCIFHLNWIH